MQFERVTTHINGTSTVGSGSGTVANPSHWDRGGLDPPVEQRFVASHVVGCASVDNARVTWLTPDVAVEKRPGEQRAGGRFRSQRNRTRRGRKCRIGRERVQYSVSMNTNVIYPVIHVTALASATSAEPARRPAILSLENGHRVQECSTLACPSA